MTGKMVVSASLFIARMALEFAPLKFNVVWTSCRFFSWWYLSSKLYTLPKPTLFTEDQISDKQNSCRISHGPCAVYPSIFFLVEIGKRIGIIISFDLSFVHSLW